MSLLQLILASLRFHWRTNLAVACGVAVGTAVLTGALLVGDSMRGSLQRLTLDRLGHIDQCLVADHFFRAALADELAAVPAILLRATLQNPVPRSSAPIVDSPTNNVQRPGTAVPGVPGGSPPGPQSRGVIDHELDPSVANQVELVGCDGRFWQLGAGGPCKLPGPDEIVLNQPLAERLGAHVGDTVLLRLPRVGAIPAESALGRKDETVRTQRLTVSEIIAAEGLGRFGLRPTQRLPRNAYVSLAWLQEQLDEPDRANAILMTSGKGGANSRGLTAPGDLANTFQLADYGLKVEHTARGYWNITSDRMLLEPAAERAILNVCPNGQPALTYLANTLACNGREVPYSTITALDFAPRPPLGPFLSTKDKPFGKKGTGPICAKHPEGGHQPKVGRGKLDLSPFSLGPLRPGEIALNSWAADQLHATLGDTVNVAYFEPETGDGQIREKTVALRLAAIVKLSDAADDRSLVPRVKGITDELTMSKWDPPFPFDAKRIRPADEAYWDRYGPTPKAFVSLATGRRLWGSRFGQTTSIRIEPDDAPVGGDSSRRSDDPTAATGDWSRLLPQRLDPAAMGMTFQPVRSQGLAAAAGTTPFGVLFLCFSFFIIAAAAMLVALLFRLGIDRRAAEMGTLLAVGLSHRQVGRLLLSEGLAVAAAGSLLGVPAGVGYAAIMLLGLRTWWLAAVVTPFLALYVTPASLAIGCLSGLVIAFAAIWLSVRRLGRLPPRRLLAGQTAENGAGGCHAHARRGHVAALPAATTCPRRAWAWHPLQWALLLIAITPTLILLLVRLNDQVQAGAFFGSGALALAALLTWASMRLSAGATGPAVAAGRGNLTRLALRNAARNPARSTLTIGLMAAATFLIVAVSAFRIEPQETMPTLRSGNGGFALVAESDQPVFRNLNTPQGRKDLGFSPDDEHLLAGSTILPLRVRSGDDASCLNLYRPAQPRVLGVPPELVQHDGFAWADKPTNTVNPWELLETQPPLEASQTTTADQQPVPVILEKTTANYALNLWGGLGETFEIADPSGHSLRLQAVALLADSIFQGELLISQRAFLKYFPDTNGYRFFLVETAPAQTAAVRQALQRNLADYGLAVETTGRRLAEFSAVQNTYLSTFQSLGGLGLLLGTLGLAAVQLRGVLERRGELALLCAVGFRRRRLAWLVLLEHAVLLTAGLGIGVAAALLAVLPHLLARAAPLPWPLLGGTLTAVLIVGLAAGGLGVRAVLRAPLLLSLREENV